MERASLRSANQREFAAATALFCLYLAVAPGHYLSVDGMLMFEQARSLLYDGSLLFREPFVWGDTFHTSLYGIGQSLLYIPTLALFSALEPNVHHANGAGFDLRRIYLDIVYALAGTPVQAGLTAFAAHRVAALVRGAGFDRTTSIWALVFFGVGSPALVYAGADFAQPLTAACIAFSLERAMYFRRSSSRAALVASSAGVAYAVLTRPLEAALLVPFVFLVCTGYPGRRLTFEVARPIAITIGAAFALGLGVTLLVNDIRYGSPFHNEYQTLGAKFVAPATGIFGLLASPARGLAWAFPAIWLAPLGVRSLWRSVDTRPLAIGWTGYSVALLIVTGSWHSWFGGSCWGPRFMIPALPLLAALAAVGLTELGGRLRRYAAWILLILGVVCAAPGVLTDFFGGYGAQIATSEGSFALHNYPPLAAWRFTTHWFATTPLDRHAIDIVWLRASHQTGGLSMIPFVVLLATSGWLAWRVRRSLSTHAR